MSGNLDFDSAINVIKERFSDPELKKMLGALTKTIQLEFPDKNKTYLIRIENGEVKEFSERSEESPDVQVTMNSDIFVKIINKSLNPVKAYMMGKIKVKGAVSDLLKLRKILF